MAMWGEDSSDRDYRRPTPTSADGFMAGLRAVPRWVWIAFAVVLFIAFAIALRGIPLFFLFFLFIFGHNKIGRVRDFVTGSARSEPRRGTPPSMPPTVRWGEPGSQRERADQTVSDPALRDSLAHGRELAGRMRRSLTGISDREVRLRATNLVDDADRILGSLRERGDSHMADVFNDRYLAPAATILSKYARIAPRDLTTARPVLDWVEQHDLPLLQRRYDEFYEQVHRGDLIDLEVASEMLAFELGAPVNGAPSLNDTDDLGLPEPAVKWQSSGTGSTGRGPQS